MCFKNINAMLKLSMTTSPQKLHSQTIIHRKKETNLNEKFFQHIMGIPAPLPEMEPHRGLPI